MQPNLNAMRIKRQQPPVPAVVEPPRQPQVIDVNTRGHHLVDGSCFLAIPSDLAGRTEKVFVDIAPQEQDAPLWVARQDSLEMSVV